MRPGAAKEIEHFFRRPSHFFPFAAVLIDFVFHLPVAPMHCLSGYFLQLARVRRLLCCVRVAEIMMEAKFNNGSPTRKRI